MKALLTALEKGSLTGAAEELGYTQSGLTHMMNSLEEELGLKLLVRSKSGVHLTPAGQDLLPNIKTLTECADDLEHCAGLLRERSFSTLRLGAYSSAAGQWIPSILSELYSVNPQLDVSITVLNIEEAYSAVKNETLDCAIVSHQPDLCQGLLWIYLCADPFRAILPPARWENGRPFPVSNFNGEKFLMPADGFEKDILPALAAGDSEVKPKIRYTNLSDAAIASMVAHDLGVSVLTELVLKSIHEDMTICPLDPPASRTMGIIVNEQKKNDKNLKMLIDCAQRTIKMINEKYSERGEGR
ncbi:MAG: LysR family transcriptional regulator [Candidatus Limivicinus sp.]